MPAAFLETMGDRLEADFVTAGTDVDTFAQVFMNVAHRCLLGPIRPRRISCNMRTRSILRTVIHAVEFMIRRTGSGAVAPKENLMTPRTAVWIGRAFGFFALLALVGAGITQVTGGTLLTMTQEHLFAEAQVLALLCIAGLVDGLVHLNGL